MEFVYICILICNALNYVICVELNYVKDKFGLFGSKQKRDPQFLNTELQRKD